MAEQSVTIPVDQTVTLEGGFSSPQQECQGGALVLHPHPLYGGSMHNNVVEMLVKAALDQNWAALRFNFRGVGASTGSHSQGIGERQDVLAAAHWLQKTQSGPLVLLGYSFGSLMGAHAAAEIDNLAGGYWVAPPLVLGALPQWPQDAGPLSMIAGDRDEFTRIDELHAYTKELGAQCSFKVVNNLDHFFFGQESVLFDEVTAFLGQMNS